MQQLVWLHLSGKIIVLTLRLGLLMILLFQQTCTKLWLQCGAVEEVELPQLVTHLIMLEAEMVVVMRKGLLM
jgi:hypothetical protein